MVSSCKNNVKSNHTHVEYRNVMVAAYHQQGCAMLNPRQVEAFRAVMATGERHVGRDDDAHHQPAVSRLIRDLELTLKLALFERRGNRPSPTAEARHLFAEVERTFVGLSR